METNIQQKKLMIADIAIPLLASENMYMEVAAPYVFHNPYIYHIAQNDEVHLLRRTLINGLLPEHSICKKALACVHKNKINHPEHLQKFGKAFLQSHLCIKPDGTTKNCWDAYRDGDFPAPGRKEIFTSRTLPKIGGCIFSYLLAGTCFCTCAWLLEHPIDTFAIVMLWCLTMLAAIPFIQRIKNNFKEFAPLIFPGALMFTGAILNFIVSDNNENVIIALWTSLGSIGSVLCLGGIGIFAVVTSFMCLFDIFNSKYL